MGSFGLRSRRIALASLAVFALAGGIAYAAIPDAGTGVFHGCIMKGSGMLRIIDPELQQCNTAHETPITFGAKGDQGIQGIQGIQGLRGPAGANGANGSNGSNGSDGVSPTVTQLLPGDSNCPAGGAAITGAAGATAYVCNAKPFSGNFTSPDGRFSLSVTDGGVEISGPGEKVSLDSSGAVTVMSNGSVLVKADSVETVANNETTTVLGNRTEKVGNNENIMIGGGRTETVGSNENVTVGGSRTATVGSDEKLTVQGNRTETVVNDQTIMIGGGRTAKVGSNESIMIGGGRTEKVGSNESIMISGGRTETVGGNLGLQAGGALNLGGSLVGINGGGTSACLPAVRISDVIKASDSFGQLFVSDLRPGSSTVCIGP